jgi:cytochrome d ubiquinol oxidase subunit II
MRLYDLPLAFLLIGLVMYTVLSGADFGAGIWHLSAGGSHRARRVRDHATHSMAPVWEANHVWLIFVLTVMWTSFPRVFASIASTLCVVLFIALIGIVLRGASYAMRSDAPGGGQSRPVDTIFALSSVIAPFALGAAVGAVAAGRVPVGDAKGDLIASWLNPTSGIVGALAIAVSAYLAAVYLTADAARNADVEMERAFRARALLAAAFACALAAGGLGVLHGDAPRIYRGLTTGSGLTALIIACAGSAIAVVLILARRYQASRLAAAVAVAAVVCGWVIAQAPIMLPGLTAARAAAPHNTLIAVVVAVVGGGIIVFPSLAVLFGLHLRGWFDRPERPMLRPSEHAQRTGGRTSAFGRSATVMLLASVVMLNLTDATWTHAVGVTCLVAFIVLGFLSAVPPYLAGVGDE